MRLHAGVKALLVKHREIEAYPNAYDVHHWASPIAHCADLIEKSDHNGGLRFLGLFGGMGSLNDVVRWREGEWLAQQNDRQQRILNQAYGLANAMRHEPRLRCVRTFCRTVPSQKRIVLNWGLLGGLIERSLPGA